MRFSSVPKICLEIPYEGYENMTLEDLENDFSNFPIVKTNQSLKDDQLFEVSFINADDNIIIDMV